MIVNGKEYLLWSQFVEGKEKWIGGTLEDAGDSLDRAMERDGGCTEITDIALEPNGKDSAYFSVAGKDFTCASDVRYLGITGGAEGWITLSGYGGHTWRIKPRINVKTGDQSYCGECNKPAANCDCGEF